MYENFNNINYLTARMEMCMTRTFVPSAQVSVHGEDRPSRYNAGRRYCTCMEEDERVCCIRGYHVFKEILEAQTGETPACEREPMHAQGPRLICCSHEKRRDFQWTFAEDTVECVHSLIIEGER